MPSYISISVGPSAGEAMPIVASNEERLVRAALRAIHHESELMVSEGALAPLPPDSREAPASRRAA